ncbi:MAG TPA: EF-P lysine aminoacylase GenX [Deltaproteobacteria bacterium]|nr:EF-P lysine aminoacylase GenX [Deltaproteobacteria bacterium]
MERLPITVRRKRNLVIRAGIIQAIRLFFTERAFLEVETPIRIPAPAPETHIDAIPSDGWFLQTSPELCMKRMLAAGYDKIFQLSKCFRHRERGSRHLPEFTMLEWYHAGIDYGRLMNECEDLFLFISQFLGAGDTISYQNKTISLEKPWRRLSVSDAFKRYSPMPLDTALADDRFDEIMVSNIEPGMNGDRPVFLFDYPVSLGSLARTKQCDPTVAERFEIYAGGLELANAFSELTDASEQRKRFEKEREYRANLGKIAYPAPDKFLRDLDYMPESAGIALGVDRLVMLYADSETIDEVVAFSPEEL